MGVTRSSVETYLYVFADLSKIFYKYFKKIFFLCSSMFEML
jgi:hypothetical protein